MAVLIGRDDELRALTTSLQRSDLGGVVLVGEPGVGKTHLLEAGLERAGAAGFATARITGSRALADLPLAAFAPLLPGRPSGDAGDLVALREALRNASAGRPLLLGVDDAHLLDDASAAVVHQLAADLTAFVIGTVRAGEVPPDAITALWKDRLVDRIEVGPLTRTALIEFGAATIGAPLDPAIEDELWRRSAGNPLFARELLLAARDAGSIVEQDGRFVRVGELPAPATVTDLLGARLATLDDDERRAVGLVALGGSLDVDVLEQLVDPDALVRLEAARLLVAEEHGDRLEVRFAHPLHADAVRHATGRLVARQLRRELADALEAHGGGDTDDVLRIVTLRLESGGHSSPKLLARAARLALRRNDPVLAERLAAATFDATRSLSAATALASALLYQGRAIDATVALADTRIDHASATDDDRARAALVESLVRFWGLGRADEAIRVLMTARASAPAVWHVELDAAAAAVEAMAGRPDAALALAPPGSPAAATPLGTAAVLTALSAAGRPDEALRVAPYSFDAVDGLWAGAGAFYAMVLVDAGRIVEAGELAIEQWEAATRIGAVHTRVQWSIVLGRTELLQGRTAAARRWFEEAAQLAPMTIASLYGRRWALGGALMCATQVGDRAGAEELVARLDALPAHDASGYDLLADRGRAWTIGIVDGPDAASERLLSLARDAIAAGRGGHAIQFLLDVARQDRPQAAAALLDEAKLEPGLDGAYFPTIVESIRAFARNDGPALADAAERYERLGATVLAAESASGAWALARETGEDARIVAARQRRAQELRVPVADLATPAVLLAPKELPLSRREREIATLVAEGRTSREVADELVIGVRTVESHLARVFDKLGIRSRTELADALGTVGTVGTVGTTGLVGSAR